MTSAGSLRVDVSELEHEPVNQEYGGVDMQASIQRYPEDLKTFGLTLQASLELESGAQTPVFVKAIQADGHMAWASPIYVTRKS